MKKNKKTRRRELLEDRFAGLAAERKADIKVPETLAEDVFRTLEAIQASDDPEHLIPLVHEKIVTLFEDER